MSVTMVVLSSSSRGLLDMDEVPGVAETGNKAWLLFRRLPYSDVKSYLIAACTHAHIVTFVAASTRNSLNVCFLQSV